MSKKNPNSPLQRIKKYCLGCAGTAHEVRICPAENCPLWPMRYGKDTLKPKREYTDEERAVIAERFRKAREAQNEKRKA